MEAQARAAQARPCVVAGVCFDRRNTDEMPPLKRNSPNADVMLHDYEDVVKEWVVKPPIHPLKTRMGGKFVKDLRAVSALGKQWGETTKKSHNNLNKLCVR